MQVLSYVFETLLTFSSPVHRHTFVLRCLPKPTTTQLVMESQLFTNPRIPLSELRDGFGNRLVSGYCPEAHDTFDFYASGQVAVFGPSNRPSPCHPIYSMETPLTRCIGDLREFTDEYAQAGATQKLAVDDADGLAKARREVCEDLVHIIYKHFDYDPGVTNVTTAADKAFANRKGVCQDYAQSIIAVCRALGIPMRYVCGLLSGEGETHAWAEAHDGRSWFGLDPTNNRLVDDSYLTFSTGRDSSDVPIERGVFHGHAIQNQKIDAILGTTLDNALVQVRRWREEEKEAEEKIEAKEAAEKAGTTAPAAPAPGSAATKTASAILREASSGQRPAKAPSAAPKPKNRRKPPLKAPIATQRRGPLTGTASGSHSTIHPVTFRTSQLQQEQQQQQ